MISLQRGIYGAVGSVIAYAHRNIRKIGLYRVPSCAPFLRRPPATVLVQRMHLAYGSPEDQDTVEYKLCNIGSMQQNAWSLLRHWLEAFCQELVLRQREMLGTHLHRYRISTLALTL